MAVPTQCPQCGALLEPKVFGKYHDKFVACPYCGCKIDVPDEFEVRHSEETVSPDGSSHRVEVSYRRRDLEPGGTGGTVDAAAGDATGPTTRKTYGQRRLPDGTEVLEVVTEVTSPPEIAFENREAFEAFKRKMREEGLKREDLTPETIARLAGGGKEHVLTRTEVTEKVLKGFESDHDRNMKALDNQLRKIVVKLVMLVFLVIVLSLLIYFMWRWGPGQLYDNIDIE